MRSALETKLKSYFSQLPTETYKQPLRYPFVFLSIVYCQNFVYCGLDLRH